MSNNSQIIFHKNIESDGFAAISELDDWVKSALDAVSQKTGLQKAPNGEVGILFCDDDKMAEFNSQFREKDRTTNVLSFPSEEDDFDDLFAEEDEDEAPYLGDIIMAYGQVAFEAEDQKKTLKSHIIHLTVHALLHLLGYDHIDEDERNEMEQLEIDILATINISNPYEMSL